MFLEAVPAVNSPAFCWLEWNLALRSAVGACRLVHLAWSEVSSSAKSSVCHFILSYFFKIQLEETARPFNLGFRKSPMYPKSFNFSRLNNGAPMPKLYFTVRNSLDWLWGLYLARSLLHRAAPELLQSPLLLFSPTGPFPSITTIAHLFTFVCQIDLRNQAITASLFAKRYFSIW